MHPPVLVHVRAGVGSQAGTHDVRAEKRERIVYRRPVGAR